MPLRENGIGSGDLTSTFAVPIDVGVENPYCLLI